jgi:hypothetical protein
MGSMSVYSNGDATPPCKGEYEVVSFNNVNLIKLIKLAYFSSIYVNVKFENKSANQTS